MDNESLSEEDLESEVSEGGEEILFEGDNLSTKFIKVSFEESIYDLVYYCPSDSISSLM